jgi:hypothetical protein
LVEAYMMLKDSEVMVIIPYGYWSVPINFLLRRVKTHNNKSQLLNPYIVGYPICRGLLSYDSYDPRGSPSPRNRLCTLRHGEERERVREAAPVTVSWCA